VDANWRAQ